MTRPRQSLPTKLPDTPPLKFEIEEGLFSSSQQDTIHTLFAPLHYEPGYSYPLLVWLHGPGCDERQLLRIMPLISMRNYVAVAPRGLAAEGDLLSWPNDETSVHAAEQRVFDSIDLTLRKFNVDSRRIFLAGFDAGGTTAFRIAMNHPYKFAGVISLGGSFPTGRAPLANLPQARQLPVFLGTGRQSGVYSETSVCDDLRLLHTAGLSITLRLYPCGHEISPAMLCDVDRWIIEQITAAKAQAEAASA